mmetsp:Transcript_1259/g.3194  ORF Transcript_1259/g.3194 Transcript_1259/m.3194 type:complete len:181 (-) Transcript_1259:1438-1980(-)
MAAVAASAEASSPKMVAESVFEMLLTEVVRTTAKSDPLEHRIVDPSQRATIPTVLEAQGYDVGYRFIERLLQRKIVASDHLEAMKFICKDFWHEVFGKQIDKLQTNHRGVFVLKDSTFRWMTRLSSAQDDAVQAAALHLLQFPCGVIRGALANLGIVASVSPEHVAPPSCAFNIRIAPAP